ncbi:hypothetical protein HQ43_04865 [Porphyromonas canoris]|uniref:Uncharacterized protein n=1 Tax=Porphyromonas canoris TaxID=36875 RepID=A0ABR4XLS1_9PORP|nr:hypothetical protein HQ43_04865 [Porphyromonas canoris]
MRVHQFGKLFEDLHHLIGTLTTSRYHHYIRFCLLRDGVLKYGLTCTERTGDKACAPFHHRVEGIYDTHTRFKELVWSWFVLVSRYGQLHGPALYHRYLMLVTVFVFKHGNSIRKCISSGRNDALHGVDTLKHERHHYFMALVALVHFSKPRRRFNLITCFGNGGKLPFGIHFQRWSIIASLKKDTLHLVQIILQTVKILGEKSGSELHFKHMLFEASLISDSHTACTVEDLNIGVLSNDLDNLAHQFGSPH